MGGTIFAKNFNYTNMKKVRNIFSGAKHQLMTDHSLGSN